jgi:putative PIN family toxin of toxin-antitoxin system
VIEPRRVVIDTNVVISAVLKETSLPALALHLAANRGRLLKSQRAEWELLDVLERPQLAPLIPHRGREWIRATLAAAELVTITEAIAACRDPDDDKFIELAVNGRADAIVTGDHDLLALNPFRDIPIMTPASFVQSIDQESIED